MFGVRQTRSLLAPADPARSLAPRPSVAAAELIRLAEATPEAVPRRLRPEPRRRLLIATTVAAVAAVAAVVAYPLASTSPDVPSGRPPVALPLVVEPIAYQETTDPEPAADHLRELAARLVDAPYDGESGDFAYHYWREWGAIVQSSPDGHDMSYVEDFETWVASDGSGRQRQVTLGAQFPDEEARRSWENVPNPDMLQFPQESVGDFAPGILRRAVSLTEAWAQVSELVAGGGCAYTKELEALYREWVIPRETRAAVLEALAGVPELAWRGEVTDRAGRPGVAVSCDDAEVPGAEPIVRAVLVFDPDTGDLLASEFIHLRHDNLQAYLLYLETGWTDERGPEPTNQPSAGPTN